MKVLVVTSHAVGVTGGSSLLAEGLVDAISAIGAEASLLSIPFNDEAINPLQQLVAFRALRVAESFDRVVTLRWPSHLIQHPNKIVWFQHHKRDLFDLWGTPWSPRPDIPANRKLRELLRNADTLGLREARRVFALSQEVSVRVERLNGMKPDIFRAALPVGGLSSAVRAVSRVPFSVLYLNRVTPIKRQRLMIEAMASLPKQYRLTIAGFSESASYVAELRACIASLGLESRVTIRSDGLNGREKLELLASADCLANFPFREDSHGFPTLEGALAGATLVTTTDSGGIREFVHDGVTGVVAKPSPDHIAAAIVRACGTDATRDAMHGNARRLALHYIRDFRDRIPELLDA